MGFQSRLVARQMTEAASHPVNTQQASPYGRFGSVGDQAKGIRILTPLRVSLRFPLPGTAPHEHSGHV